MTSSHSFHSMDSEAKQPFNMTSAELRKINKPIVEKRRRERINGCLDELKTLLIQHSPSENNGQDPNQSAQSKLEKADILEMAVRYLRNLHRQNSASDVIASYRDGFSDCAKEVATYLRQTGAMNSVDSSKMLSQLATRLNDVNSISYCSKLHKFVASSNSTQIQPLLGKRSCPSVGQETPLDNSSPVNRLAKHRRRLFQHQPCSSKRIRCGEPEALIDSRKAGRSSSTAISESSGVDLTKACDNSSLANNRQPVTVDTGRPVNDRGNRVAFSELDINGNNKGNQIPQTLHEGNNSAVWRPW